MKRPENITVIGCGTMGHSIVLNVAWAGLHVTMYGLNADETEKGLAGIAAKLDVLVNGELIKETDIPSIMQRITITHSLNEAAATASLIIEAIPENLQLKHDLFKSLENIAIDDVVFASNTSGLAPSQIAEVLIHPERFIVLHFWNPAHLVPLVEVVGTKNTNDTTLQRSIDLLNLMHKKPVVVKKEIMGFIGDRLQAALSFKGSFISLNRKFYQIISKDFSCGYNTTDSPFFFVQDSNTIRKRVPRPTADAPKKEQAIIQSGFPVYRYV